MGNFRMPWFLTFIVLIFTYPSFSDAKHNEHPSAVVIGTVYRNACSQQDFPKTSDFISGALVAVECGGSSSNPTFHEEVKTNEHGEFRVHLPLSVSKHVKKIKGCSVKLISGSEPYCSIALTATTSSSLHLKSGTKETHLFSSGFFTFKRPKQPTLRNQKPSNHNSKEFNSWEFSTPNPGNPNLTPSTKDPLEKSDLSNGNVVTRTLFPPIPGLPPFPFLPPPFPFRPPCSIVLPYPFQPLPSILPPNPIQPPPSILPPNRVQSPPSVIPPNQLQPPNPLQTPPSLIPPNPFQPPPSLLPPDPLQPPNPLQPPPSLLPPNPLQPPNPFQPPPSLLPPNPLQPPPSIFPTNPFQPPPPVPSMFPPNPFPPVPGLSPPSPGIPPLSPSRKTYP